MPFGLDLKSIIVGIILAYFVIPWIQSMFYRSRTAPATTTG